MTRAPPPPPVVNPRRRLAVGYARVSTDDQVKGYSLDHQRDVITSWCVRQGIPLVGIETADEHGESGKDLERPALRRVIAHIDAGEIGWVVVAKIDRLSRSLEDTCALVDAWDRCGVTLVAPGDGLDQVQGGSRTYLYLRSWMAQEERRRIVARVGPGLLARAQAGLPLGRLPIGYKVVADASTGEVASRRSQRLVPDPITAPMVQALFAKAAQEEWGARRLAAWASQTFVGTRFTYGQVAALLENPIYIGTLAVRVGTQEVLRLANHEPLISEALFHAVQDKRRVLRNEHLTRDQHVRAASWLGGIARCGRCGKSVTLRTDHAESGGSYQCQSRSQGIGCGAPFWPQDETDTHVLDRLYAKLTADLAAMGTLVRQAIEQIPEFLDVRRAEAAVQLERCDLAERELVTALERGLIAPEQYPTKEAEIRAQRASAQVLLQETDGYTFLADLWRRRQREPSRLHPEVARLLAEMPRGDFSPPTPNTARVWMPLPLVISAMSLPERRRLLRAAIDSVELSPRETFPVVTSREGVAGYAELGKALGRSLAQGRGFWWDERLRFQIPPHR